MMLKQHMTIDILLKKVTRPVCLENCFILRAKLDYEAFLIFIWGLCEFIFGSSLSLYVKVNEATLVLSQSPTWEVLP